MEKGKGKVKSRETEKDKGIPYRSRLISLKLDEHMFRGPDEVGGDSIILLFKKRFHKGESCEENKNCNISGATTNSEISMKKRNEYDSKSSIDYSPYIESNKKWWNLSNYLSLAYSSSLLTYGSSIQNGFVQKTRNLDLIGASLDLQIGTQLSPWEESYEVSIGIGRHLGIGLLYDKSIDDPIALVFHFGIGLGLFFSAEVTSSTETLDLRPPSFPRDLEFRRPPTFSRDSEFWRLLK